MSGRIRVVHVAGPGRSGAGLLAGVLRQFGLHVPQPDDVAAPAGLAGLPGPEPGVPRGPSEPRWVVDLHGSVLHAAGVRTADPRPIAWHLVDRAAAEHDTLGQVRSWLQAQVAAHGDLVIKDPRLPWFLELWQVSAAAAGAAASSITVLRAPLEVVGAGDTNREPADHVAGWINLMLGTELVTRAAPRAFVRHRDLVHDWDEPVFGAAAALDLPMVDPRDTAAVERVDALIDPTPRPDAVTWDDVPVPAPLRALADDTWAALDALPGHDDAGTRAEFDRLRALYPYVHRRIEASLARRIAQLAPAEVVPSAVRQSVVGMFRRSRGAAG